MAETVGPTLDKRVIYLSLMLLTLAYPLIALTLIVKTENDYDDEGRSITPPLPQVTCPVEGAEGDIDCVASPLAYAHIDTIIWVFVVNEVVLHFTYVLYTKLWATAGIVFGFWREFLSITAFLAPELSLNSFVYFCQTLPFMRKLIPSLKTQHMPLLVGFFIGAMLSTLYGLGTAQTTDQFRRAVTLAGPGTMFLFVDWFSRSVFLPFFELMQNTFTQLKVNTFLLALFELVLTNLYGSLFLPATQKLCVVLARFFYNVSYGVDSKVSLYDYVNLRPLESGLDPSDPLSKRTTLVSPKDIGTYEPEVCRSSISSLAKRKRFTAKSAGGETLSNVQSSVSQSIDASARQEERPWRKPAARDSHTNAAAVGIDQDGACGTKRTSQLPATQKRNDISDEQQRGQAAESKQGEATGHNRERLVDPESGMHRKGNREDGANLGIENLGRPGSNEAARREPRHLRERNEAEEGSFPVWKGPSATGEKRGAGGRRKHSRGPPDAESPLIPTGGNGPISAVDVEASRTDRTLRPVVEHFLSAPHWSEVEGDNLHNGNGPVNTENAWSPRDADAYDDAKQQNMHDTRMDNQPGQIDEQSLSVSANTEDNAPRKKNSPYNRGATTDMAACVNSSGEYVCLDTPEPNYCDGIGRIEDVLGRDRKRFSPAKRHSGVQRDFQYELEPTDAYVVPLKEDNFKHNRRSSRTPRASASQGACLKEYARVCEVVGSGESLPGSRNRAPSRVAHMNNMDNQQISVESIEDCSGAARRSEKCHRKSSSMPGPAADEHNQDRPRTTTAAGGGYDEEQHTKTPQVKRPSHVEAGYARGRERGSLEDHTREAQRKRQSQIETNHRAVRECDYAGEQARRAHRRRHSQLEADERGVLDDDYTEEHARRAHRKRQPQLEPDGRGALDDDYAEEHTRRVYRKRQSLVEADDGETRERHYIGEEPARRGRSKRHSQEEADYRGGREYNYVGEQVRRGHGKRQSRLRADNREGLEREYLGEQARRAHGKRQSELDTNCREGREWKGNRGAQERITCATGTNAPRDGKGDAKAKASRKHRKKVDDELNDGLTETAKLPILEAKVTDADALRKADPKQLSHPGSSPPFPLQSSGPKDGKMEEVGMHGSRILTGSELSSVGHRHSKGTEEKHQPFRNNIYIPYRKGFGSDAVEFEKIITWFNMIWDSWRFLLLRTVMVKASNVFIFLLMIFKDYIYSMWHFCVRYDERCILTSLELRSVNTRRNRRILSLLGWFQALVVRPFFMPTCLATTTWRSQLLFGLNAQKAQSRMRGVAVIRHSKRKDFGLRTLSNFSDNAPLDAPNEPTPQKAVRGCGVMLKTFFKDLGHDIAAHFKVELELATTGLRNRTQTKSRAHLFRRSDSSLHGNVKAECTVHYNYGSELVVIRNVPVTMYSRGSRSSASFTSRSRSTSGSDHQKRHTPSGKKKTGKIILRDLLRSPEDSAFRKIHSAWISQVVEEVQSLVFNRTWPRLLQKLMSSLSLVASDIVAEHTKIGLLPAYRTFGLFRTFDGRVRLFLLFSLDILEVMIVWKVQSISRFYKSIKEGFNNLHDGPLLLLCTINCAGTLMYFGLLRYIRFASINGDKRILPDVNRVEVLTQLNLTK